MEEDTIHFRLTSDSLAALREFAEETGADLGCRPVAKRTEAGFQIDAYLPETAFEVARAQSRAGLNIEWIENFSEASRARRSQVSRINRYASRGAIPRGLGVKE